MKKILFFTSSRSDFGILSPLLKKFTMDKKFHVGLIISGTHLEKSFGSTEKEIKEHHYNKIFKIKIKNLGSNKISNSLDGLASLISEVGNIINTEKPDLLFILGDRQEIILPAYCALLSNVPIAHIGGGDSTYGAIDNQIRHAVSQLSTYHFVTNKQAFNFLCDQKISKKNIFLSGSLSDISILEIQKNPPNKIQLLEELNIKNRKNLLICSYHPETKKSSTFEDLKTFLNSLSKLDKDKFSIIFTSSNGDKEGKKFNKLIKEKCNSKDNFYFFNSLGIDLYLRLVSISNLVIGNSSSALHEVPSLSVPSIDIGGRQKGRTRGASVFHIEPTEELILKKIKSLLMKKEKIEFDNPYMNDEDSSSMVYDKILKILR